ncbi:MAG: glycosyltransferase [Microcoleaceae cyanobacterium]
MPERSKTIVLFDSYQGGHHLTYLRLFSQSLLELGCRVLAFYPQPEEIQTWINHHFQNKADHFYAFKIRTPEPLSYPVVGRLPQPVAVLEGWQYAAKVIERAASAVQLVPDLVFFNWVDSYFSHYLTHHLTDRVFPYHWSGIYFQPGDLRYEKHSLPILNIPLAHYGVARSSHCRSLGVLDETITQDLQAKIPNPVVAFPDVTDESAPDLSYPVLQEIRYKAAGRKIVGLIGSLNKRKGLLTLLKAAEQVQDSNLFFVFAGNYSEYGMSEQERQIVQEKINANPENCFFYFKYIPDEPQFNALITSCDILFAAYENFPYSSNILTKAAVFKKPVIVSRGFCMGKRVEKFKLGLTIPEQDTSACIQALLDLETGWGAETAEFKPEFEEYHQFHSVDRLKSTLETLIDHFW